MNECWHSVKAHFRRRQRTHGGKNPTGGTIHQEHRKPISFHPSHPQNFFVPLLSSTQPPHTKPHRMCGPRAFWKSWAAQGTHRPCFSRASLHIRTWGQKPGGERGSGRIEGMTDGGWVGFIGTINKLMQEIKFNRILKYYNDINVLNVLDLRTS